MTDTNPSQESRQPVEVFDLLAAIQRHLATLGTRHVITGTVTSFRTNRGWANGEIVTYHHTEPKTTAKIRLSFPPGSLPKPVPELKGALIAAEGNIVLHALFGLQFQVQHIRVVDVESEAARATRELVASIKAEGLDKRNKALALGNNANRIAVVCPAGGGAGGADFYDRLDNGSHDWELTRYDIGMGGANAVANITSAITTAARRGHDAVVVCRGGGAASDMAPFDSPDIAKAIVLSPTPIVSAVGHATDRHVADLVAHISLPTPSAAAAWFNKRRGAHAEHARNLAAKTEKAKAIAAASQAARAERDAHTQQAVAVEREHRAQLREIRARRIAIAAVLVAVVLLVVLLASLIAVRSTTLVT